MLYGSRWINWGYMCEWKRLLKFNVLPIHSFRETYSFLIWSKNGKNHCTRRIFKNFSWWFICKKASRHSELEAQRRRLKSNLNNVKHPKILRATSTCGFRVVDDNVFRKCCVYGKFDMLVRCSRLKRQMPASFLFSFKTNTFSVTWSPSKSSAGNSSHIIF